MLSNCLDSSALKLTKVQRCLEMLSMSHVSEFIGLNCPGALATTFMYVMLRVWRANEGGTTDLPDYSETVPRDRTLFEN